MIATLLRRPGGAGDIRVALAAASPTSRVIAHGDGATVYVSELARDPRPAILEAIKVADAEPVPRGDSRQASPGRP